MLGTMEWASELGKVCAQNHWARRLRPFVNHFVAPTSPDFVSLKLSLSMIWYMEPSHRRVSRPLSIGFSHVLIWT